MRKEKTQNASELITLTLQMVTRCVRAAVRTTKATSSPSWAQVEAEVAEVELVSKEHLTSLTQVGSTVEEVMEDLVVEVTIVSVEDLVAVTIVSVEVTTVSVEAMRQTKGQIYRAIIMLASTKWSKSMHKLTICAKHGPLYLKEFRISTNFTSNLKKTNGEINQYCSLTHSITKNDFFSLLIKN